MAYTVETTLYFDKWLRKLKNHSARVEVLNRISKIQSIGYFGDYKTINSDLQELRFFSGAGYRIYFTVRGNKCVLLLVGGVKDTQQRDIQKALKLLKGVKPF